MTDRIDQMTHEELKTASRDLFSSVMSIKNSGIYSDPTAVDKALDAFKVSALDKVRELLKAEGWEKHGCGVSNGPAPTLQITSNNSQLEMWIPLK